MTRRGAVAAHGVHSPEVGGAIPSAAMKVVYLAGPYRAESEFGVHRNIHDAELIAIEVWRMGAACICPHKNTAYFGGSLPDSTWLEGDLELVRRSDAVLLLADWESSSGARAEKSLAGQLGIPVLYDLSGLGIWLIERGVGAQTELRLIEHGPTKQFEPASPQWPGIT